MYMLFYTFCCDIGRMHKHDLLFALQMLLKSMKKHIPDYKLICYTNFRISSYFVNNYNVEFRQYYDKSVKKVYDTDQWLNLNFNRINIYKDLYDEFKQDYIWIDLDTIITSDLSFINNLSHVFVINGGNDTNHMINLFVNNDKIKLPINIYIQGNFWKLNIELYNILHSLFINLCNKGLKLQYDVQDLFNYYIHVYNKDNINKINILGSNINKDVLYGLCVWSNTFHTHATIEGLYNLYYKNNILKSKLYPDKTIGILSFTFSTLNEIKFDKYFNELFVNDLKA